MTLATTYPNDLWGSRARLRAREEAAVMRIDPTACEAVRRGYRALMKAHAKSGAAKRWACNCGKLNAAGRKWCGECGEDRAA